MAAAIVTLSAGCESKHNQAAGPHEPGSTTPTPASEAPAPPSMASSPAPASSGPMRSIAKDELCVTEGSIAPAAGGKLGVSVPKMRAVLSRTTPAIAELRFTYKGRTAEVAALGSGEVRQQLGLKLRAQDPCNLIYAMWRIEPKPGLVVQIKRNAGMRTSRECKNGGYSTVKPRASKHVPDLAPGSAHVLRAELTGSTLRVLADGEVVWEGDLGPEALTIDGPIGVRSDDAAFDFELFAPADKDARPCAKGLEGD